MFIKPNNSKFYEGGNTKILLIAMSCTHSQPGEAEYLWGGVSRCMADLGKKKDCVSQSPLQLAVA